MQMRLRMLKHGIGKGHHVMKQLHVCLRMLQYYAKVATERAGYVLYRALVSNVSDVFIITQIEGQDVAKMFNKVTKG